ncbi:TPA: ash family protein [Escherichia coli]
MNVSSLNIDSAISGRYTVQAPYKAGAGIGVLKFTEEHNRARAVFSCHEHCYAQIMVGRAGASQDAPGSSVTGYANPVRLTTSVIGVPCGEYFKPTEEAAIMATVPTSPYLKIEVVNGKAVTTSLFEYLKLLRLAGVPGYISCVAVNPATGFSSLNLSTAHNRASGFFVCNAQSRLNYGGLSGGAERLAGDCGYRSANPAQVTTSCLAATRGGLKTLSTGAVTMTTTTTHPFLKIETVNGKAVIFSLHVACHFKRMHQNIVDKIEYLNCSRDFFTRNFIPGTYHIYGDSLRGYYITLDGLMMLQLGLSLRTMRYYESCIEAFHEAETSLSHTAFRRNQWEVRP